jgi:hypothetical protein
VEEPVVGAPWHQWERGGSAHGVGGTPGKRRRELQLGLEKGGARGSVAEGGGSACWPLDGLGRRPLGQKDEQAGGAAGPTRPKLKRNSF